MEDNTLLSKSRSEDKQTTLLGMIPGELWLIQTFLWARFCTPLSGAKCKAAPYAQFKPT